jgi:hypothetical protein
VQAALGATVLQWGQIFFLLHDEMRSKAGSMKKSNSEIDAMFDILIVKLEKDRIYQNQPIRSRPKFHKKIKTGMIHQSEFLRLRQQQVPHVEFVAKVRAFLVKDHHSGV